MRLLLLGGLESPHQSFAGLPRKARALLAWLALHPGNSHPRERLAALFWDSADSSLMRQSLRQALAALRRVLGADGDALLAARDTIRLEPGAVSTDVADLVATAGDATAGGLDRHRSG